MGEDESPPGGNGTLVFLTKEVEARRRRSYLCGKGF